MLPKIKIRWFIYLWNTFQGSFYHALSKVSGSFPWKVRQTLFQISCHFSLVLYRRSFRVCSHTTSRCLCRRTGIRSLSKNSSVRTSTELCWIQQRTSSWSSVSDKRHIVLMETDCVIPALRATIRWHCSGLYTTGSSNAFTLSQLGPLYAIHY